MLESLPEDSTYEDIQYHLYVLEKIRKSADLAEIEGGIPHDQAKKRLDKRLSA